MREEVTLTNWAFSLHRADEARDRKNWFAGLYAEVETCLLQASSGLLNCISEMRAREEMALTNCGFRLHRAGEARDRKIVLPIVVLELKLRPLELHW